MISMGVQLIGAWPDILLPKDILPNGHFPWRRKKHLSVYLLGTLFSEELLQRKMLFPSASESCTFRIG